MRESIIGIDPGPREFAWVLWNGSRVLDCGDATNCQPGEPFFTPSVGYPVAIEWIESFGMAVGREVFETVFSIGRMAAMKDVRLVPAGRRRPRTGTSGRPSLTGSGLLVRRRPRGRCSASQTTGGRRWPWRSRPSTSSRRITRRPSTG